MGLCKLGSYTLCAAVRSKIGNKMKIYSKDSKKRGARKCSCISQIPTFWYKTQPKASNYKSILMAIDWVQGWHPKNALCLIFIGTIVFWSFCVFNAYEFLEFLRKLKLFLKNPEKLHSSIRSLLHINIEITWKSYRSCGTYKRTWEAKVSLGTISAKRIPIRKNLNPNFFTVRRRIKG